MFADHVYAARRRALMDRVAGGCILLAGNELVGMNYRANTFPFRQDASFLYFTGLDEPGLVLWLDCDSGEEVLFGPVLGLDHTIWSGPAPSLHELGARCGIERTAELGGLSGLAGAALKRGRTVHYLPTYQGDGVLRLCRFLGRTPAEIEAGPSRALIRAVVALRSVKDDGEVMQIRQAVKLSAGAYAELMTACAAGVSEMELYGRMLGFVLASGGREAFPTILSRRGEVLHNHSHDQILGDGDLLLVDSGVLSSMGYASDITRTLPTGGAYTTQQREIYEIVLSAMAAGIAAMAPGVPFLECHLAAAKKVAEGLSGLGLMRGNVDEAVAAGAHALFFPHGLGHMLGLDVHDMESLGEDNVGYDDVFRRSPQFGLSGLRMARRLAPGFVMTVEPGIYFIPALVARWRAEGRLDGFINYDALDAYLGFGGIRVEDDVLVTATGTEVLSASIPKSADAVCAAMGLRK